MFPFQRKFCGFVMTKGRFLPTSGAVAVLAFGAELLFVRIIRFVAGDALFWRLVGGFAGGMAKMTADFIMSAFQLEFSFVMIEPGLAPF